MKTEEEFWKRKLLAFLHDPPHKPAIKDHEDQRGLFLNARSPLQSKFLIKERACLPRWLPILKKPKPKSRKKRIADFWEYPGRGKPRCKRSNFA